jgi:putative oxidoreductase
MQVKEIWLMNKKQEIALGLLRVVIGIVFIAHGYQKFFQYGIHNVAGMFGQIGIPLPVLSAYLAASAELFGGIALLLGLLTRVAAIPVAVNMIVAILQVHLKGGFFLPNGFEYALVMLAANIAFITGGGGAFALDNVVWPRKAQLKAVAA